MSTNNKISSYTYKRGTLAYIVCSFQLHHRPKFYEHKLPLQTMHEETIPDFPKVWEELPGLALELAMATEVDSYGQHFFSGSLFFIFQCFLILRWETTWDSPMNLRQKL